jgi:hypothetical protein
VDIDVEIGRAARFGQRMEDLVYHEARDGKIIYREKNDDLLLSYWSLIFDYCKGITCLLQHKFYSPAFALLRPLVEAQIRAHIGVIGSDDEVAKIRNDHFKANYEKDGRRIDEALGTTPRFEGFLKNARSLMHSLTHSGRAQLWRRWDGDALGSAFSDEEIFKLLAGCSVAVFLITALVTAHFELGEQKQRAGDEWAEYVEKLEGAQAGFRPFYI